MGSEDNFEEEREFLQEEVILEGRVEEGVAIAVSDSDDNYESSSSSGSKYLPCGGEDLVEEFGYAEPVAGPSRPDTSRPVGVVATERRANIPERAVSPPSVEVTRLLIMRGTRPIAMYTTEMT